jgi:hypothetical protein
LAEWETNPVATTRVIHIDCPYDEVYLGRSVVNERQEIAFVITPDLENPSRAEYDLTVTFRPLDEDDCAESPFPWPRISRMIGSRIPDEPTPYYFPLVEASWRCQDLPWCDPAEEYVSLNWLGGDLSLVAEYFALVRPGTPTISLVTAEGTVLASATPSAVTKPASSHSGPRSYETYGQLNLAVKSLPKGRYFLALDGPLPTYFLYRNTD